MSEDEQSTPTATEETVSHTEKHVDAADASQEEEKQVPLKALQAERRKRQEAESQAKWLQDQMSSFQQKTQAAPEVDDSEDLLTKGDYKRLTAAQLTEVKRQTVEESYLDDHPEIASSIESELPEILKEHPELAHAIANSTNRYKAAWKYIQKLKPAGKDVRTRIQENESKPGSPASIGKSGSVKKELTSMSKEEFREYRQKHGVARR